MRIDVIEGRDTSPGDRSYSEWYASVDGGPSFELPLYGAKWDEVRSYLEREYPNADIRF